MHACVEQHEIDVHHSQASSRRKAERLQSAAVFAAKRFCMTHSDNLCKQTNKTSLQSHCHTHTYNYKHSSACVFACTWWYAARPSLRGSLHPLPLRQPSLEDNSLHNKRSVRKHPRYANCRFLRCVLTRLSRWKICMHICMYACMFNSSNYLVSTSILSWCIQIFQSIFKKRMNTYTQVHTHVRFTCTTPASARSFANAIASTPSGLTTNTRLVSAHVCRARTADCVSATLRITPTELLDLCICPHSCIHAHKNTQAETHTYTHHAQTHAHIQATPKRFRGRMSESDACQHA